MKRLLIITGAVILSFAPLHAKTHCKPAIRYSVFYKHPAYVQGFNDGYDGLAYCNSFRYIDERMLYETGYEDGNIAYLEDNLRYTHKRLKY